MQLLKALRVAIPITLIVSVLLFFQYSSVKATENFTETTYYFLTDHLGSTDVVLDDQGNIVERADYLPFGSDRLRIEEPNAPDTDYKFTGKEKDDETGLFYYGARYYDADIGRFISEDNWEGDYIDPQTLNKYTYTLNNPVKYIDPSGNKVELVGRQVVGVPIAMHSFLRITPDSPKDFGIKNAFTFTMGGQGKQFGNLWGEFNNAGDLNNSGKLKEHHSEIITTPNGDDTQFIKDILKVHGRSGTDKYDLLSKEGQYNCNNYSTSLLLGAGAKDVSFNNFNKTYMFESGLGETIPTMMDSANNGINVGWENDFNNKVIGKALMNDIMKEAISKVKSYFTSENKEDKGN